MRICITAQATFNEMPGGAARHLTGLSHELRRTGHDVHVLTSTRFLPDTGMLGPGFLGKLVRAVARVVVLVPTGMWFVVRHRPDVVNVHFAPDSLGAVVGAAVTRRRVVATFHGPWALEAIASGDGPPRGPLTAARRAIERLVYVRAAACIAMSGAFADLLVSEYSVRRDLVHVVAPGIDMDQFPLLDRQAARASLGLSDRPTVVTVRRLVPRMGLELAIQAVARIPSGERPVLVIAGTGPDRERLEALAAAEGVGANVRFLGFVPDDRLARLYAAGDVCVVPSRELEGFGYGALEALAAGTPVVAVRTGGLAELVGELEPRWLVPWDADAMAAAIAAVLHDPSAYPSRDASRAYAARFGWPTITSRTVDIFRRIATSHTASA